MIFLKLSYVMSADDVANTTCNNSFEVGMKFYLANTDEQSDTISKTSQSSTSEIIDPELTVV